MKYIDVLEECGLFGGMNDVSGALRYLHARQRKFMRGEYILRLGDEFRHSGVVLEGEIECGYQDSDFNKFNMNHFSTGDLFGESMACAEVKQSPMQISAVTDCKILFLDYRVLYDKNISCEYKTQLLTNLIQNFSGQNFFLNRKIRILSQKDLRSKILVYLHTLEADEKGARKLPFSKTALAEFLCANRTALSRELSRMIQDGILTMDGRNFVLL